MIENTILIEERKNIHGLANTPDLMTEEVKEINWRISNLEKEIMAELPDGLTMEEILPVQVKSLSPNDFGVYDMAGNVAEWVADVYRPIVDDEANDFNYYRGNIYLKNAIGEDGKRYHISPDELVYDTLPNGKVMLKRLPGQIGKVPIDEEETFLRQNFSESDNRNFRDGDKESTRLFASSKSDDEDGTRRPETAAMYDAPIHPKVT